MDRQSHTPALSPHRVALYLRISTGRQADNDLSIPDQRRQLVGYAEAKGWPVVAEFVESGNTATDDRRPAFQAMIEGAQVKPPPFDTILVHSFSRFFRDQFQFEFYARKLARNRVRLVSITQELGDDPMGLMMRQIMALFDEYQSRENAKHTLRAMKENTRQGYWNGARPPIGYRVVDAEKRGDKIKRKLEIDPEQADTVRLIFTLALGGVGNSGSMSINQIVKHLNAKGVRTRDGGRWGVAAVHQILTRSSYVGEHHFNVRNYKTGQRKALNEHAVGAAPPIVELRDFEAVQSLLRRRRSNYGPGRISNRAVLLGGILHCGFCGGAMHVATGNHGRYRYYVCNSRARNGPPSCGQMRVPLAPTDAAAIDYLERRLLCPDLLGELLSALIERRRSEDLRRRRRKADLQRRVTDIRARLARLYEAIEIGVVEANDPCLKERVQDLQRLRDEAQRDAEQKSPIYEGAVTPSRLRHFANAIRKMLRDEDGTFRRELVRALADRIEIHSRSNLPLADGAVPFRITNIPDFKSAVLQVFGARARELVP